MELGVGTTITIPVYIVHRHRLLWRDPLKFDPTRFAAGANGQASFALPEGEKPTPFARITLRPKEGLKLNVTMLAG